MPYAQEDMEAYAPTCGVAYDAKVKGIRDGLLIMPICTTRAAQACVRNTDTGVRMPISLLRTQHITHVNYVLLAITESNILITAVMNTIHGLLTCTHDDCGHACTVVRDAMGGFKLHREQCRQHPRRGEWTRESFDACASYLRSSYQRLLNHDEWSHLEVPIICRYRQLARSITVVYSLSLPIVFQCTYVHNSRPPTSSFPSFLSSPSPVLRSFASYRISTKKIPRHHVSSSVA